MSDKVEVKPIWSRHMWWLLAAASFVTLGLWLRRVAGFYPQWPEILLSSVFIVFLVNFPIPVGEVQISLAHAVSLTLGLTFGPGAAGLSLIIGMPIGELIRSYRSRAISKQTFTIIRELQSFALSFSRQLLSLAGGVTVYLLLGGRPLVEANSLPALVPAIGLGATFSVLYFSLHWLDHLIGDAPRALLREFLTPFFVSIAPVPFAIISAASYAHLGLIAIATYGFIVAIVSPVVRNLVIAERDLQRRLQELSTINRVSQAMRTSLDLNALLTTIYLQVAHLLEVNSFYIALHSSEEDQLSYPLAVKDGNRQNWPSRPMMNRLTDRVIRTAAPILIPREAPMALSEMGFPEIDNPPQSWVGVPLINPERTIGCLAVFHTEVGKTFSERDLDVLTTLAGQASVAIENALLYEQTRDRAQTLGSLNEITASMSSSLDPERTLELVCISMIRVGGGEKSAIFLLEEEHEQLFLARATNVTDDFMRSWMTIPIEDEVRIQAFHSQVPILVPDISTSHLTPSITKQFEDEGISAFADFPLVTPSGTIGQLSVYFAEPQRFRSDQVETLKIFAAQAALAVTNARAHAATDQALQRRVEQLATLEAIGREINATLDNAALFETILSHALRMTNAAMGHLAILETESNHLKVVAHRAYPIESPLKEPNMTYALDEGIPGRVFQTAETKNVLDVREDADHVDWTFGITKSLLSVPILRHEEVLGVITVENATVSAFTSEHEQFLIQLASQAAVALVNAGLYQQVEARLREQSLLYQASSQIASTFETDAVALAIADSMAVTLSIDGATVSRWDPKTEELVVQASVREGGPAAGSRRKRIPIQDVPSLRECLEDGRPLQWNKESALNEADRSYLMDQLQTKSILALPLIAAEQNLGIIEAYSDKTRVFDKNAVRIAQTIASQAAIALENTDLFLRISESNNRLIAVLNSTQEGMLMADTLGNIVLANDQLEHLTKLPVKRLVASNLADKDLEVAHSLGYRADELENRIAAIRAGKGLLGEIATYDTPPPGRRTLQRADAPVRDAAGQLIGWLVVLRDITEERELNEARDLLTEMIVHDLRSPLTAILGSLKLLDGLAESEADPVASQALSVSNQSVQQMLTLVNSLLDIAKLEAGELVLEPQSIELEPLFVELVNTYVHDANENGIILECDIEDGFANCTADEELLRRVLANLLDNALKFTPVGGRVSLKAELEEEGVLLSITDTGPGIPEEFRDRIFERFAQVPGISGRRRGTGLGLAFSKLAIDAHGGKIWVEDNPAGGSLFRILLPSSL
jgi:signal transduction histidine kinase